MNRAEALKILELAADASDEEITKAYRRMAMKYHPDRNKEAGAEDRFKQAKAAHEYLIEGKDSSGGSKPNFGPEMDLNDFAKWWNQNNQNRYYGTGQRGDRPKVEPIDDYAPNGQWGASGPGATSRNGSNKFQRILMVQIALTLEEAFKGCQKTIAGVPDPSKISGRELVVEIPPGLSDGQQFKNVNLHDGTTMAMHVKIITDYEVAYAGPFNVNGAGTIAKNVNVDVITLILGGSIEHTCIDGSTVKVHIPKGLHAGALLKLQGKGYWSSNRLGLRGDCLLRVTPMIMKLESYPKEQLELLASSIKSALKEMK
jgi:DnaJ-class molecular chaperone